MIGPREAGLSKYNPHHPTHAELVFAFLGFEGVTRYKLPWKPEKMKPFMGTRTVLKKLQ